MKKKQQLNIELFKKVRDRIASIPESYDQDVWVEESTVSPCGTVACLAGETIICAASSVKAGVRRLRALDRSPDPFAIARRAARLLGLEGEFASGNDEGQTVIFDSDASGWPFRFRRRFETACTYRGRASAAVAYLDHIIETGKVLE